METPADDIHDVSPDGPSRSQTHVVMMVANDVTVDTRVRKMAESLASTGVRVTILGIDHVGDGFEGTVGAADLVVVKAGRRFRSARSRYPGDRSKAYWVKNEIEFRNESFLVDQREAASQIEWIREDGSRERLAVGERAINRKKGALDRYSSIRLSVKGQARRTNRVGRIVWRAALKLTDLGYTGARSLQSTQTALDLKRSTALPRWRERLKRRRLSSKKTSRDVHTRRSKRKLTRDQRDSGWVPLVRLRRGHWRKDLPEFDDYEAAIGPLLDRIDADVFHAHDVHLLGVAARAAARARYRGVQTRVVYDAHEYIAGLARYPKRMVEAYSSVEREYIDRVDRVITVSEPLADLLQTDFRLERRPTVVLNIPQAEVGDADTPSLFGAAGVPLDSKIAVYSGGIDEARNVHTIVKALPLLPDDIHLVLVANRETSYILSLYDLADELGVRRRLHLAPFVEPNQVVSYLSEATIGIHPMISSKMNHQIALPNKLFEYLYAGLPMCVSDNKAMMDFVTETGVGTWFIAEDPHSLATAVAEVLADRETYVQARYEDPDLLRRFSWNQQATRMVELYRELLDEPDLNMGHIPTAGDRDGSDRAGSEAQLPKANLAIGPNNFAGQANLWAHGLMNAIPNTTASAFMLTRPSMLSFPASLRISGAEWMDARLTEERRAWITRDFTHVLIESGSPVFGGPRGASVERDIEHLRSAGVSPALVFHGTDIRNPAIHRDLVRSSPFEIGSDFSERLEVSTATMIDVVNRFDGPVFVSTKDLLDYIPAAHWLPITVDTNVWVPMPVKLGERRVVVGSTFTNRHLKGADHVDAVCKELANSGHIDYRRYANVPPAKMPEIIADIDVVIDGVVLGLYGVTSVEGMAMGRLVLANIDRVIDKKGEPPPIVSVNPSNVADVLLDIVQRPDHYRELAANGPSFVARYHDGRCSAQQLSGFLGVSVPSDLWAEDRTNAGVSAS